MKTILVGNNHYESLIFPPCIMDYCGNTFPSVELRDDKFVKYFIDAHDMRISLQELRTNLSLLRNKIIWLSDLPSVLVYITEETYYTYWIVTKPSKPFEIEVVDGIGEVLKLQR